MPGFVHHLHDPVEAHHVRAVGERGVGVGIESPGCRNRIAFDAGHLHQSAYGVAGEPQVVFEPHLRGVFDLRRGAAEKLACRGGGHGTCHADLALAADLGAGDRSVGFGHVAEQSRRSQGAQDPDAQEIARIGQVVEHCRNHAARPACGGGYDDAAGCILFGGRQGVGVDLGAGFQRVGVALRLDPVGARLAGDLEPSRQYAVVVQAALDRFAHHRPYPVEVIPYFGAFAVVDIFPIGFSFAVAPVLDLRDRRQRIDAGGYLQARTLVRQGTPADAVYRPSVDNLAGFQPLEQHAVGMEGQHDLRLPDDLGRGDGLQHRKDRHVGEVSLARGGKRSVECHTV